VSGVRFSREGQRERRREGLGYRDREQKSRTGQDRGERESHSVARRLRQTKKMTGEAQGKNPTCRACGVERDPNT
jgi:hypothetical protein